MKVFLLSNNGELYESLQKYFELKTVHLEKTLLAPKLEGNESQFLREFFNIFHTLRTALFEDRRILVLVDTCCHTEQGGYHSSISSWSELTPLSGQNLGALLAMLMLTFPEIHWVFLSLPFPDDEDFERKDLLRRWHFLFPGKNEEPLGAQVSEILTASFLGYRPLFDPLGIRNKIRKNITEPEDIAKNLPKREKVAAAIDEEIAYAYFNAYVAYRFGYRAWAITTKKIMESVFSPKKEEYFKPYEFSFEDIYLNFPDRGSEHYSNIEQRDENYFPGLTHLKERYFVTVGHGTGKYKKIMEENALYFHTLRLKGKKIKKICKPFGGIFDLYHRVRLKRPEGFKWPPKIKATEDGGHSSPGRLLLIAKGLIDRSEKVLKEATTVRGAITSALLALEAKELLVSKTPTTALEALSLQHKAEITAESMFYGVEYNIPLKDRFREIKEEVHVVSKWIKPVHRKRSEVNTRLTISEELAKRFSEMNQFEEEQAALNEARRLRFIFWAMQKPYRWLFYPLLKYVEISLRSISIFFAIVLLWGLFFGAAYYGLAKVANRDCDFDFWEAMGASTVYYFTLQSPQHWTDLFTVQCPHREISPDSIDRRKRNWNIVWDFLLAFQGIISLFNLGLLISHIYLIISRR